MYYVYIIRNKDKKFYKGSCKDIKIRLDDHNNGRVFSTKSGRPWSLLYFEAFASKSDALREEKFLKIGKGRERIKYLLESTINEE